MLSRITGFVAAFRRAKRASALLKTADSLHDRGLHAEAVALLKELRAFADPPGSNWFLMSVQHMTRLRAATLLSITAAKCGDTSAALEAIEEGLRLWAEIKGHMRPSRTVEQFTEWEAWATKYTASSTDQ
jgi:hypothetical protein